MRDVVDDISNFYGPILSGTFSRTYHNSQAGNFAPECFQDDNASQRKGGKFDPASSKNPELIVTKICMGDNVLDPYSYAKFHHDTIAPFPNAKMRIK